jgi:hypothetical protein
MFENEQSDEVKNRVKAEKMWDYRCVTLIITVLLVPVL